MPGQVEPRDDSRYRVALELLEKIANLEGVILGHAVGPRIPGVIAIPATREWILKPGFVGRFQIGNPS